jgi:hypothetical protein
MRHIILAVVVPLLSVPAGAQQVTYLPTSGLKSLYVTGTSTGTAGVISQEDTLCPAGTAYNLPAGTLANIGDRVRIFAAGGAIANTDTKNIRLRFGTSGAPSILSAPLLNTASGGRWSLTAEIVKTGANAQSYAVIGTAQNTSATAGVNTGTTAITDTAAIPISLTGQDSTTALAGAVFCQYMSVDLLRATTQ